MTTEQSSRLFLETLFNPLRHCGLVALALQADVVNFGKEVDSRATDSEQLAKKRAAKTKIDELVQDMLLVSLSNLARELDLSLDAEEKSRFASKFATLGRGTGALILDPIDGTLEYIQQRESYSICAALRVEAEIVASVVFFPARDRLYYSDTSHAYVVESFIEHGLKGRKHLVRSGKLHKRIYINRRVPHDLVMKLQGLGVEVHDDEENDIGAPDAILSCLEGHSICYLSHTRQLRDILLGAIVGKMAHGYALDWGGRAIEWPDASRLDRGVFGCWEIPDDVMETIREFAD